MASLAPCADLFLDSLDLSVVRQGWGEARARQTVSGGPIVLGGRRFDRGIGTHAWSEIIVCLEGRARSLHAWVGIADDAPPGGIADFHVYVDGERAWSSGELGWGDVPREVELDLRDRQEVILICDDADRAIDFVHGVWADARLALLTPEDARGVRIRALETLPPDIAAIDPFAERERPHLPPTQRPPMGWNSWNAWGAEVDQNAVLDAGKALLASGLARLGYRYVNIDDGWAGERDGAGHIQPNDRFPNLGGLVAQLHDMGLRAGIYSSPGRMTCAGYTGSFGHEDADAMSYATHGFDLLKYDYCTYMEMAGPEAPRERHIEPYRRMAEALKRAEKATGQRVDLSICTAGWFDPWEWAAELGAVMWRTTSDVFDTWGSVTSRLSRHDAIAPRQRPGRWNDPDMLVVGRLGWGRDQRPGRLTRPEQVAHLTLWAMLSAPLLIGCNLAALDQATLDLLANPEVLAIDQDPLGCSARRVGKRRFAHLWLKPLDGGAWALALVNRGPLQEAVEVDLRDLGLPSTVEIRDVWRRSGRGQAHERLELRADAHAAVLYRLSPPK